MAVLMHAVTIRDAQRTRAAQVELAERMAGAIATDGHVEPLPGLHLYRHAVALEQAYSVVEPSFCMVAQGSIEQLAQELGVSVSDLHHHFKAVTGLSPLQYQKRLRLLEGRQSVAEVVARQSLPATALRFEGQA